MAALHKPSLERIQLFVSIITAIAMLYIAWGQFKMAHDRYTADKAKGDL